MDDNHGRVVAFYSFKGGIGQSTTIASVASLLVKWHRKVLLVDCDPTSDGLIGYFSNAFRAGQPGRPTPGGLHSLLRTVAGGTAANWRDHVVRFGIEGSISALDILPGGASGAGLNHWSGLIELSAVDETSGIIAYLEALRRDWCAEYDIVLIDSKPPMAYVNAMWTLRLADAAVIMLPTHEDILHKAFAVVEQSLGSFHAQSGHRATLIVPVTARYEDRVASSLANSWIPQLVSTFQTYYQAWAPGLAATSIAEKLKIQHQPEWNWQTPSVRGLEGPGQAFGSLARLIAHDFAWRRVDQYPALPALVEDSPAKRSARQEAEAEGFYRESCACREARQIVDGILLSGMALSQWRKTDPLTEAQRSMIQDVTEFLLARLRVAHPSQLPAVPLVCAESDRAHHAALASALCSLSALLAQMHEYSMAAETQQGGVDLRRRLAGQWPGDYEPELARALHNLAKHLAAVADRQNAIKAAAEAVAIRRRWSRHQPARYALMLARSLANLALRFDEGGERQKAMLALREAVVILRRLVRVDVPNAQADLARTLTTLARLLRENGDGRMAASTMWDAVRIWMRLRKEQPAFAFDLALAFDNFSRLLATANEGLLAITAAERAVQLLRRLTSKEPNRFESFLARSLNNLSTRLAAEGYSRRALDAAEESVRIRSRLAAANPERHGRELAQSLNNLSNRVAATGNWLKALDAIDKAVSLHSRLHEQHPTSTRQDLAVSLYNKSLRLVEADEAGLAMTAVENLLRNVRCLLTEGSAS
jgi:cellulose biosynthesis protein BcsQ/tetratricopeptide (TPR) repeat protein